MPRSESEPEAERGGGCKKVGIHNIVVAIKSVHLGNSVCIRPTQTACEKHRDNFILLSECELICAKQNNKSPSCYAVKVSHAAH